MDELVRAAATAKNVTEKKLYLFTDATSEYSGRVLGRICANFKKKNVELEVL